jgi:hypothetical protein
MTNYAGKARKNMGLGEKVSIDLAIFDLDYIELKLFLSN